MLQGTKTFKVRDHEAQLILELLPEYPNPDGYGYFSHQPYNAFVCYNRTTNRLEIFPNDGGWLGIEKELLDGDLASFSD